MTKHLDGLDGLRGVAAAPRLDFIQALRGIAAVLVMLRHAGDYLYGTPFESFARSVLWPGFDGVDLFFLISGFIMVYTTRNVAPSPQAALSFCLRRFARIWPPYAIVTTIFFVVSAQWFGADLQKVLTPLLRSIVFIPVNFQAMAPYFGPPTLGVGWTLSFEALFYALFAASLLFGRWRYFVLFAFGAAICFAIPAATGTLTLQAGITGLHSVGILNFICNPMIVEFFVGALIGLAYLSGLKFRSAEAAWMALIMATAIAIFGHFSPVWHGNGPTYAGIYYAIFFAVCAISSKAIKIPTSKATVMLGDISYSLYLTHTVTFFLIHKAFVSMGYLSELHTLNYVIFVSLISLVVARICYLAIERPSERAILALFRPRLKAHFMPTT